MENASLPNLTILHGDDTFAMQKVVNAMVADMGDPSMADLNIARLDGKLNTREEIKTACDTLPFLSEKRLIIVTNALARLQGAENQRYFEMLFEHMAPTTALVLVIEDTLERKKWHSFPPSHWLHAWVKRSAGQATYKLLALPEPGAMPGWITTEANARGGSISRDAAQVLAGMTNNDTRMAAHEIEKLLAYTGYKRKIETADVEQVSVSNAQHSIFDLVDSLSTNNKSEALRLIHALLEEQDGLSLLAMINRQFRLLILAREIVDEGRREVDVQTGLGLHPYVAQKLAAQCRKFNAGMLEDLYRQLLEMDIAIKTGKMDAGVALDQFAAGLQLR